MGAEQSMSLHQRRMQASPVNSLFERAVLDALLEIAEESSVPSEQIEHAWDPDDCSPRFRVLSDRLTARRLPSPLTTDAIRGLFVCLFVCLLKQVSSGSNRADVDIEACSDHDTGNFGPYSYSNKPLQ